MLQLLARFLGQGGLIFFLAVLTQGVGKAASFPVSEEVGDQGLLVGQIAADDFSRIWGADLFVNGKKQKSAFYQGYILLALDPGQYRLNGFYYSFTNLPMFGVTTTNSQDFPVDRSFTIEAGKVSNVGLMAFMSGRGQPLFADNSKEMSVFLQDSHPALFASLRQTQPIPAPAPYLGRDQINQLRFQIAKERIGDKNWRLKQSRENYVSGPAGTLARIIRNGSGQITTLKVLETNTLADLRRGNTSGEVFSALLSRNSYLVAKGDMIEKRTLPSGMSANSLALFGKNGVVVADDAMNLFTSLDDGKSWNRFGDAALSDPLDIKWMPADQKNRFGFHYGREGMYVYSLSADAAHSRMAFVEYQTGSARNMNMPESVEEISTVYETEAGLFIGPHSTYFIGKVHFLPTTQSVWQVRDTAQHGCRDIAFPDYSGRRVELLCSGAVWASDDLGISWSRIARTGSLFKDFE